MSEKTKNTFILASVFITGASVLIVEIIAMRILSPYFGNTIYATSSVIGIILGALSLGYYFGGKMADKYPRQEFFYGIICISGLLVVLLHLLSISVLPMLGILLSISEGPLITSLLLFFIPGFFLGTLSPFAIKLSATENSNIGSQSGKIFFWSTLGSITGSFSAGFFLIPNFGVDVILVSTGVFLTAWGLLGLWMFREHKNNIPFFVILLVCILLGAVWIKTPKASAQVIYQRDGVYEKIQIIDGRWEGRLARFLFQDRSYSAAMYHDSPDLVFDYTKYYALYQAINPEATSSLVIGGGAYSIPKALLNTSDAMHVDVAEIEPRLFDLAKQYFNLSENPRLTNYTQDGRQLLARNDKKYDIIISDVYYSLFSIPVQFTTEEFFDLAKSRLAENGVFIGNFSGYLFGSQPSFIASEIKTFKETFPNSYFFAVNSATSGKSQNIIFFGINGETKIDFDSELDAKHENPIFTDLAEKNIDIRTIDMDNNYHFTDNFAPVEHLIGKVIDQWN